MKKDEVAIIKILAKKISNLELDLLASNGPAEGFYKTAASCHLIQWQRVLIKSVRFVSIISLDLGFGIVVFLVCFPVKDQTEKFLRKT